MATSKDDGKTRKVMDVAKPGKTAPPASAKPIIVTNRPMLRRDPMMAPAGDGSDIDPAPEAEEKRQVSRVARTIKVTPMTDEETADTIPVTAPATEAPATPAHTAVVDKTIALEIGQEAVESLEQPVEVTVEPTLEAAPTDELTIGPSVEPEQVRLPHPADSNEPIDGASSKLTDAVPAETEPAAEVSSPVSEAVPPEPPAADEALPAGQSVTATKPEALSETPVRDETSATDSVTPTEPTGQTGTEQLADEGAATPESTAPDAQLAANEVHADTKRKVDAAATERQLEVEKIISSKQYYLPIATQEKQRGLMRSLLVLAVVIVVAIVWLDVVLDAGIVRIPGAPVLTHFFH